MRCFKLCRVIRNKKRNFASARVLLYFSFRINAKKTSNRMQTQSKKLILITLSELDYHISNHFMRKSETYK